METKSSCCKTYEVARRHGYPTSPGAARKAASSSASSSQAPSQTPSQAPQTADRGEGRVATAVRDSASVTIQAEPASGEVSTGFGDQVQPNLCKFAD
ncbi:hypothetical protein MTO96_045859 [Rhipicephalus appendiculatus]